MTSATLNIMKSLIKTYEIKLKNRNQYAKIDNEYFEFIESQLKYFKNEMMILRKQKIDYLLK